jgi:iron complex transport system permease protein
MRGKSAWPLPLALLLFAMVLGILWGTEPVSIARAIGDPSSLDRTIIVDLRLPRVALAAIAGGGLAVVGVAFQSVLRNPLAEPYVLGVSGGAALGATIAILLGLGGSVAMGQPVVPLVALASGMGATALVWMLARSGGRPSGTSILLAGVVVNAIASAAITFLKTLVSASKAQELLFWLMGFLELPRPAVLASVSAYVAIGTAILFRDAARLNLLALGDESAAHLGVDVRTLQIRTFFACSLVVGAIVSATGLIGFVGLVVPHALRTLYGPDARRLLPASLLGGAATLTLCDLISRGTFRIFHTEPPVGAVTALLGGPVFLLLLKRRG